MRWPHWSLGGAWDLRAQTVSGTIQGSVNDASGAAVPNAQITIANQDTGASRETMSTGDGVYSVPSLLPGKYSVSATAQGFSPAEVKDIVVNVGSDTRVDLKLQVGQMTQLVTVTEAVPMVETTSSEVSEVMTGDVIKDIPLNARDVQQLAVIQPGVQFMNSDFGGRAMTVIGDRPSNNRFLQEGIDTTTTYRTSPISLSTGIMLGAEAVQEFKVLTTDLPAEYGEQSGGTVNIILKSGTNSLHGSAYEYYRNAVFDARNFFDQGTSAPPFNRNQFGASLGGPIKKDNTFFYVNFEGFRSSLSLSDVANVPNAAARGTGNGSGQVPCSGTAATSTGGCGSGAGAVPRGHAGDRASESGDLQRLLWRSKSDLPGLQWAVGGQRTVRVFQQSRSDDRRILRRG